MWNRNAKIAVFVLVIHVLYVHTQPVSKADEEDKAQLQLVDSTTVQTSTLPAEIAAELKVAKGEKGKKRAWVHKKAKSVHHKIKEAVKGAAKKVKERVKHHGKRLLGKVRNGHKAIKSKLPKHDRSHKEKSKKNDRETSKHHSHNDKSKSKDSETKTPKHHENPTEHSMPEPFNWEGDGQEGLGGQPKSGHPGEYPKDFNSDLGGYGGNNPVDPNNFATPGEWSHPDADNYEATGVTSDSLDQFPKDGAHEGSGKNWDLTGDGLGGSNLWDPHTGGGPNGETAFP